MKPIELQNENSNSLDLWLIFSALQHYRALIEGWQNTGIYKGMHTYVFFYRELERFVIAIFWGYHMKFMIVDSDFCRQIIYFSFIPVIPRYAMRCLLCNLTLLRWMYFEVNPQEVQPVSPKDVISHHSSSHLPFLLSLFQLTFYGYELSGLACTPL